jgi:hypothetical protein
VLAPNADPEGPNASTAMAHGAFDDDPATLQATLARILDVESVDRLFPHNRSSSANSDRRSLLQARV